MAQFKKLPGPRFNTYSHKGAEVGVSIGAVLGLLIGVGFYAALNGELAWSMFGAMFDYHHGDTVIWMALILLSPFILVGAIAGGCLGAYLSKKRAGQ